MSAISPVCLYCMIHAVILLVSANVAPILANKALGRYGAWPVDNRLQLHDGYRLFGNTKTWRGVCAAIFLSALAAELSGIKALIGALFGIYAMVGDLLASFIKRRMGRPESSRERGLDTVPESLLPVLLLQETLGVNLIDIILVVAVFFLIEEWGSPVLYRLHIRKRPY